MAQDPHNGPQPDQGHDPKTGAETYTPQEAGRILGVSDERIRQMAEAGELEGQKVGGRWHIDQRAVHDALKERGSPRSKKLRVRMPESPETAELHSRIGNLQRELGRLEGRLELTKYTESTLREQLDRMEQRADRLEEEARTLRHQLDQERARASRSWWSRLFGTGEH